MPQKKTRSIHGGVERLRNQTFHGLETSCRQGSMCALYDALRRLLDDHARRGADPQSGVSVPTWVLAFSLECVRRAAKLPIRGRRGTPAARERQRFIDFVRWDMVSDIRRGQQEYREELSTLQRMLADKKITRAHLDRICTARRDPGRTWDDAYDLASEMLADTFAFGGADAMKKSYLRVQQHGGGGVPSDAAQREVLGIAQR
jgi:hypothetical protein